MFRIATGQRVFTHGKSGFILFQHMLARTGQSQDNLSLGLRIEF